MDSLPDLQGVVARLRNEGLLPEDHRAVLCVGSVARGWANERSDYDLVVVTGEPFATERARPLPVPLRPGTVPTVTVHVDGRRWEIKYWTDDQIGQLLDKVSWERFDSGTVSAKVLLDVEELCLERLLTCIPLVGEAWVRQRCRELGESAFRAFAATRSLAGLDSAVEDALGQLDAGDTASAVLSARRAVGHVVDALLESHGCFGSAQPKWRARRFQEAAPAQLSFEEYWALETMRGFDPAAPEIWVKETVEVCNRLCMEVEI
ncbi:nucleotidyltransferase domain-containing protein [Streptomyces sp. PKU-EA00015]|uniref:nucleotidyltransferase domain-containing protein n=1 Tax=Streptomyces sp. PKU-EA00015 TaxID=2748326 RepID=UPI0015A1F2A1|nr:nucleotidyltransferase domain-containing protein [Streptomyces sp. PKU-EA00015]NWF29769.1 nucleotidyltransferase domain-containing protein [Streptomyces sp. PKU-EA00015]